MTGTHAPSIAISIVRRFGICIGIAAALVADIHSAHAVVAIFDGFGDADRNNDGSITAYDTDWNDNGTFNDPTGDAALITRGVTEVTAAQNASDVGIVWSGIRSFDTAANLKKSKLFIVNDSVAIGAETSTDIHNDGLALGVESRGGGSSLMGRFGSAINLGTAAGDKVVVSFDWRHWREPNDTATNLPGTSNELRWGLFQDTDNELGQTGPFGTGATSAPPGATVMWGRDDGNWFASQPGAEGDKGIHVGYFWGSAPDITGARIRWENNVANINGGTNNGRLMEGNGATDVPGGGDTGTIATAPGNGTGGILFNTANGYAPHSLKMEIVRLANGLAEVASYVDNVELLRDTIKTTDTGYTSTLQSIPFSYNYFAIRNANNDWDYVIDNFQVEVIPVGVPGDFNGNSFVDAADYVLWRENVQPLPANEVSTVGTTDPQDYTDWRARFGNPTPGAGGGIGGGAVPEPAGVALLALGVLLVTGFPLRERRQSATQA